MSVKQKGIIHSVGELERYGQKFRKRVFVLKFSGDENDQYSPFEAQYEDADDFNIQPGSEVEVEYSLTGRLWKKDDSAPEKCFSTLLMKSINVLNAAPDDSQRSELASDKDFGNRKANEATDENDIPF